jgi:hypothetical protein
MSMVFYFRCLHPGKVELFVRHRENSVWRIHDFQDIVVLRR